MIDNPFLLLPAAVVAALMGMAGYFAARMVDGGRLDVALLTVVSAGVALVFPLLGALNR